MWNSPNNPSSQSNTSKNSEGSSSNNAENLINMAKAFSSLMNNNSNVTDQKSPNKSTQPPSNQSNDEVDLDEFFSEFANGSNDTDSSNHPSPPPQNASNMDIEKMMNMAKLFSTFMGEPPKKKTPVNNRHLFGPPRRTTHRQNLPSPHSSQWTPSQFDEYIQTPSLNMLKAAIPYFDIHQQRLFGVLTKALELKKVMDLYPESEITKLNNPFKVESNWKLGMLKAVRPHCTTEKQTFIDMIAKMMDMSDLMGTMGNFIGQSPVNSGSSSNSTTGPKMENIIEALSSSLNPQQKQMMDMFSMMMKQNNT